jgi:hypothetical protein
LVLTVSFELSLVIGLSCHHRLAEFPLSLTPASRRQDHTTSPSAPMRVVFAQRLRPSHPAPNVRDDREAPLLKKRGMAERSGFDLPDGASKAPATRWHDGQIAWRARNRVK